jgi:tetratricopeptide (TPR) repeat protein
MLQSIFGLDSVPLDTKISLYDNAISEIEFYRRNFYAINTLNSVLRIKHPDSWEITERYATHLIRAGELDQALVVYKKELQKPTAGAEAYSAVVDIESYLGRRDSVMHYLNLAIEKFPTNERLNLYRAYELQQADASEKTVVAAYKKYIKVATNGEAQSSGCAALGDYYYAIGKPKECFRWYSKALDYNADNALTLNNWAYFISELIGTPTTLSAEQVAELVRALAMSVRACELSPSNATYLDTQAWILHLLGRNEEAKGLMKQAISLDTTASDTLLEHYADILAATGESFMAEIYYKRSIKAGANQQRIEAKIEALKAK